MNGHPMKIFAMWLKTILMVAALCSFAAPSASNSATVSWTGGGSTNNWSESTNWGGAVPVAGDILAFPSGVSKLSTINDLPAGTVFSSMVFNGGGYSVSGNLIALSAGISVPSGGSATLNAPLRLAAAQSFTFQSSGAVNSPIDLNGFNLTLNGYGTPFNGVISGTGNVTLSSNEVRLNANNTYIGTTTVNTYVAINGLQPQSDVTAGGQLFGAGGSLGNLMVTGMLAPGSGNPCCSSTNGAGLLNTKNLAFNTGSSFSRVDINGATAGSGYDQIKVTGTVTIGSSVSLGLNLSSSFVPTIGQVFTLIDNDGTDAVSGTFNGYPQGAIVTLNSVNFQISYVGGDGNDVTLTTTFAPKTWTGAASNLWSSGGNWLGGAAPVAGDKLVFPSGALNLSMQNDLAAGTVFDSMVFNGGGYSVSGNLIALSAGISVPSGGSATLNAPLRLAGAQSFTFQSSGAVNSPIDLNGFNLTLNGYGTPFNGVISGTGNVTLSSNEVRLNANNTYIGTTTVNTYVAINGLQPQSDVTAGGQLFGAGGSLGNLMVTGMLAPGSGNPCCSSTNGAGLLNTKNLAFNTGSSFSRVDINGATAGSGYDQIKVTGTVTIGSSVSLGLNLSSSFVPTIGQVFTLIDNDGADAVSGTFNGLSETATITLNGAYPFRISYVGGTGNDVTVTSLSGLQPTTVALSASPNPSIVGQTVTFTTTVSGSGGTPSGTITFADGASTLSIVTLSGGTVTYATSTLSLGPHSISASYSGDNSFGASTSGMLAQAVNAVVPSTLAITTTSLAGGTVGTAYSATLAASGGTLPYTWSASGLPAGLNINSSGAITGMPTTAGTYAFTTATVTDTASPPAAISKVLSMLIVAMPGAMPGDADGDGIADAIDRDKSNWGVDQSLVYSSDFNDGVTSGRLIRNGWTVTVIDAILATDGVRVSTVGLPPGGSGADIDSCDLSGGSKRVNLNKADDAAIITCGSSGSITVLAVTTNTGQIKVRKPSTGPALQIGNLGTGQTVTMGSPVTAGANNGGPILVQWVDGNGVVYGSFQLDPSESVDVSSTDMYTYTVTVMVGSVAINIGTLPPVTLNAGQQIVVQPFSADTTLPTLPTVPTGLTASAISATQINLSWAASTDNVGVTGFKVYRGGALLAALGNVTSYSDTGLTSATAYSYTVAACAGNCSAQSTAVSVTTPAAADTQAPTVPTGLTVSAISTTQINLLWTASTDNVGVTGYKVYRGGVQVGTPAGTNFIDTSLTSATAYSYTVTACDAAGNCSAQSAAASATTRVGIVTLVVGWNLIGNGTNVPLDVAATLGDASKVTTVWKWMPTGSKWAFYTPSLVGQALTDYAATKGYEVLTSINGGEGFWVNAKQAFTVTPPSGNALPAASFQTTLTPGWNLIAIGEVMTPSQFNLALSLTPPSPGAIPLNLTTLWAWEASQSAWYFYAPSLEANGGLTNYITSKNYRDFTANSKTLGQGVGFWVNRP